MKRLILILLLGEILFPLAAQERLTGIWTMYADEKDEEKEVKLSMHARDSLVIREDASYLQFAVVDVVLSGDGADDVSVTLYVSVPGHWSLEGETLSMFPDKKRVKTEVKNNGMPAILRMMLVNAMKKELVKELKTPRTCRIALLTTDELHLVDETSGESPPGVYRRQSH